MNGLIWLAPFRLSIVAFGSAAARCRVRLSTALSQASITSTISLTSQSRFVTPAAIAWGRSAPSRAPLPLPPGESPARGYEPRKAPREILWEKLNVALGASKVARSRLTDTDASGRRYHPVCRFQYRSLQASTKLTGWLRSSSLPCSLQVRRVSSRSSAILRSPASLSRHSSEQRARASTMSTLAIRLGRSQS